jgi:hypothetical protein
MVARQVLRKPRFCCPERTLFRLPQVAREASFASDKSNLEKGHPASATEPADALDTISIPLPKKK